METTSHSRKHIHCWIVLLCLTLSLSGCGTSATLQNAQQAYRSGYVEDALGQMRAIDPAAKGSRDQVLVYLERGAMYRDAGDLISSNQALARADSTINDYDRRPEASLSRGAIASVTNLNTLPYEGTNYDRIMLAIYRALNYFELGDFEAGRTELFRAYNRQQEAVQRNAKRITKAEEAAAETERAYQLSTQQLRQPGITRQQPDGYLVNDAQDDARFQNQYEEIYGPLNSYSAYGNYVNPLAEFLQALIFTRSPLDGSDIERGRLSWERTAGMVSGNNYLNADLRRAIEFSEGKAQQPMVYVIFATGVAPERQPVRIDLPLFYFNDKVDYFGAAFPKLAFNANYQRTLEVLAEDESYPTEMLSDMDNIVAREFRNELPTIIIKTLIATGTKATLAYFVNEATSDSEEWVNLLARIAVGVYQYANNQADLRTWASLPKEFQYASLPRPANGQVQLAIGNQAPIPIDLYDAHTNIIYVRSINPLAPLSISIFKLPKS